MDKYITIPLSKTGKKYKGMYEAIVSIEDADLAEFNWTASHGEYAIRAFYPKGQKGQNKIELRMHCVIMERILGYKIPDDMQVDHKDLDTFNNRRENLRLATHAQNRRNTPKRKISTSEYKGVTFRKDANKWQSRICVNGKRISLGFFNSAEEAHRAYCDAAIEYFGEFANFG